MLFRSNADVFLNSNKIAVAGVSENRNKYGYKVYYNLKMRGYELYPVNPNLDTFDGQQCYNNVSELPEDVESLICITPPAVTEKIVEEAASAGIKNVWMQPGAESAAAVHLCEEKGISSVYNACIMMM